MKRVLLASMFVLACCGVASAQQYTFYFAHITTGAYDGGSWRTTIFLTNATGGNASATVTFTQSDGTPYNITFFDDIGRIVSAGNTIPVSLGPGETRKYESTMDEPLTRGYATITASAAILGTSIFTQYNAAGQMVGEAGISLGIPLGRQAIFVDTTNGFKTGFAIANPQNAVLEVHFELLNTVGQMVASTVRSLGPFQHISMFIHEMFPDVGEMIGRLQFYCTNPMVSVGLRFDPNYSLFTTLPPVAIAGLILPDFFRSGEAVAIVDDRRLLV